MATRPAALRTTAVLAAVLVGILGCTPAVPSATQAPLPPIDKYVPSDWDLERRQELLTEFAEAANISEPPEVTVVRWVNPEEASAAVVECLQDAGFSVKLESNGYSSTNAPGQQVAYDLADYACNAQYPVRLDIDRPFSETELDAVHQHLVDVFLPCVTRQGYGGLSAPSRTAYDNAMRGESLDPVYVALTREHELSDTELTALLEACPLRPPGMRSHES